jgi:hypothetical protein
MTNDNQTICIWHRLVWRLYTVMLRIRYTKERKTLLESAAGVCCMSKVIPTYVQLSYHHPVKNFFCSSIHTKWCTKIYVKTFLSWQKPRAVGHKTAVNSRVYSTSFLSFDQLPDGKLTNYCLLSYISHIFCELLIPTSDIMISDKLHNVG